MNWEFGIFFFCLTVLYILVTGGIGMYINAEKGRSKLYGFLLGAFLPIIGLIIVGFNKPSSAYLVEEAQQRNLISMSTATTLLNVAQSQDSKTFASETKLAEATQVISLGLKKKFKK